MEAAWNATAPKSPGGLLFKLHPPSDWLSLRTWCRFPVTIMRRDRQFESLPLRQAVWHRAGFI